MQTVQTQYILSKCVMLTVLLLLIAIVLHMVVIYIDYQQLHSIDKGYIGRESIVFQIGKSTIPLLSVYAGIILGIAAVYYKMIKTIGA